MPDHAATARSLERRGATPRFRGSHRRYPFLLNSTVAKNACRPQPSGEFIEYLSRATIGETEAVLGHLDASFMAPRARPTAPCWSCFTTRFWRRSDSPWIWSRCHPPPVPDDPELTWFDLPEPAFMTHSQTEDTDGR